ncbi:MAG TPA: O-antigen ligase family protein, partial [Chthoniobacterales bacterium]
MIVAFAFAAGLAMLQMLIGGRGPLFPLPGYALLALTALAGIATVKYSRTQADSSCLYATALFCSYIGVRALLTPGYFARADIYTVAGALVVYGLTATVLTSSRARLAVLVTLLAVAMPHVLIGAVQFTQGNNFMLIPFLQRVDYGPRASGFFVCPNHLAGLLEVVGVFGVSITCWSRLPMWAKLLVGYATAGCYLGVALTGSRGGYLSVLASLLAFAFLTLLMLRAAMPRGWVKFGGIAVGALAAAVLAGTVLMHQNAYLSGRAGNIIDRKNVRMDLWRAAVQQWQLQPILGTGAGTYRFYGRHFRTEQMQNDPIDVHNDYLHLLCEYGLLGLAAFGLFFAAHARQAWRGVRRCIDNAAEQRSGLLSNRRALLLGGVSAVAAYVVHSGVDFNLHVPANAMLLAFVFGMIANAGDTRHAEYSDARVVRLPRIATALIAAMLLLRCGRFFPAEYHAERARTALRDEDPIAAILSANESLRYDRGNPEVFFYLG